MTCPTIITRYLYWVFLIKFIHNHVITTFVSVTSALLRCGRTRQNTATVAAAHLYHAKNADRFSNGEMERRCRGWTGVIASQPAQSVDLCSPMDNGRQIRAAKATTIFASEVGLRRNKFLFDNTSKNSHKVLKWRNSNFYGLFARLGRDTCHFVRIM